MANRASRDSGKLPGKTEWAGRRRPMTRQSGYSVRGPGGQLKTVGVDGYRLERGARLIIEFHFPALRRGDRVGFGGWFYADDGIAVELDGFDGPRVLTRPPPPDWGKFGSQWEASEAEVPPARFIATAERSAKFAYWDVMGGRVEHEYLDEARDERPALLTNMHSFAPEANFIDPRAQAQVEFLAEGSARGARHVAAIALKSCNRCARFLPVNVNDERAHLSFTNHCVATHRRPCEHSGFGRLVDPDTDEVIQLEYGFQLECRFCKKFEVNAAHNPQRTAGQMKEDAARRRYLELLLDHLYAGTPQLRYRQETGRELSETVWERFGRACFKCGTKLARSRDMHLDHTRPLALLWPLDDTATSLCATHNSEKRDRPPVDYYSPDELERLAAITRVPLEELQDPSPNLAAIERLSERLDWFFTDFLEQPALTRTHEGKLAADLLVKALQKVLNRCSGGAPFDLVELWSEYQ